MKKYDYWHIVLEVGNDFKDRLKIGTFITHHNIHDGYWVPLLNSKTGKESGCPDTYKIGYLGRLEKNLSVKDKLKRCEQLAIEKGHITEIKLRGDNS